MYQLIWDIQAYEELDNQVILLSDEDRLRVVPVVRQMEHMLRVSPHEQGESRSPTVRVAFFDNVFVQYWIDEPRKTVHLMNVRLTRLA